MQALVVQAAQAKAYRIIDFDNQMPAMNNLPDLEAWAIFATVAQTGSFARAAEQLSLSQATVSKAIARLEARVKANLLHRTSRQLALTPAGESALARAGRILEEGHAIEAEIADQSTSLRGTVRIAAPMSFGLARLAPMLPGFMQLHPDVELDLGFSDAQVDLIRDRYDMALRIAQLVDSTMLARQLCTVRLQLVATPAYWASHGRPQHPQDLAQHQGLQYSLASYGTQWPFRHAQLGEVRQTVPTRLAANNAEALKPALLAGLGLSLQPAFLVWQELRDGTLETAMPDWLPPAIALHIVTPPGRSRPARVQAFIDYAAQQFMQEPWAELAITP